MSKKARRPRRASGRGERPITAAARRSACEECGHMFVVGEEKKLAIFGDPASWRVLSATALCVACHKSLVRHMREAHGIENVDVGSIR